MKAYTTDEARNHLVEWKRYAESGSTLELHIQCPIQRERFRKSLFEMKGIQFNLHGNPIIVAYAPRSI